MNWSIATRSGAIPLDRSTPTPAGAPPSNDADTDAWVAAVVTAGGTVSAPRTTAVNDFIVGLKADGLWTKLDRYWLFASEGSPQATLVDIRSLQSASAVNSPALGSTGYTFDNSAKYINSGCAPNSGGTVFVLNSAHVSSWMVSAGNWALAGHYDGSFGLEMGYYSGALQAYGPNDNATGAGSATGGTGLMLLTRTAASGAGAVAGYVNGTNVYTNTTTSVNMSVKTIWFGGLNVAGHYTLGTMASASIGSGLNSTDNTNFYNRQRTLMTACGVP